MWKLHKNNNKVEMPDSIVAMPDIPDNNTGLAEATTEPPSPRGRLRRIATSVGHKRLAMPLVIIAGTAAVGIYFLVISHAAPGPIGIAFEANTNNLWVANSSGVNTAAGMMPGTSPSIAAVPGGAEIAFQANTGSLWVTGPLGTGDLRLGMMAGTNPSIIQVPGGFEVAFQANTGHLWVTGTLGTADLNLGMMPGTSPSIASVATGGYQIAFQANTSALWVTGALGTVNTGLGMMPGTSPNIATEDRAIYEVAFQANTGHLWTTGSYGADDTGFGMMAGSSPDIATLPAVGGFEVAFQANTSALYTFGHYGTHNWGLGMYPGSSPSIAAFPDGSFNVAFEANTTSLWVLDSSSASARDLGLGMHAGTSPSIQVSNMPTPPTDPNIGSSLSVNQSIQAGQALYSPNGAFRALMQADGNFVVYVNWDEQPLWSSGTHGSGSNVMNFQADGNLVVRPSGAAAAWASGSNTYGGTTLNMQDDGNLVQYNAAGIAVWSRITGKITPPAVTASLDGPTIVSTGDSPKLTVASANASSCTINGTAVSTNGTITKSAISSTTTYTLSCAGFGGPAKDSVTTTVINAIGTTDPLGSESSNNTATAASKRSLTQATSNSNNWTGFVLKGSKNNFTEIEGSFVVPSYSCPNDPEKFAESSIWIGLDGSGSPTVEQVGIDLNCYYTKHGGWDKEINPWWEMYSAHDRQQTLTWGISPGDKISMKVWYNASNHQYGLYLKDATTGQQFTNYESCATGISCNNSSAEWIVERASYSGTKYPFVDFNPLTFTDAEASTNPSYSALPFSDYPNYPFNIQLVANKNDWLVSLPGQVAPGVSQFTVDLLREI
jgi:hypothetical protein